MASAEDEDNPSLMNLYTGPMEEFPELLNLDMYQFRSECREWSTKIMDHVRRIMESSNSLKLSNWGKGIWFNSLDPLYSEEQLCKKLLVIDFFTYCCINCEHALKYIKAVEEKYKKVPYVEVLGIHSPKFSNEKVMENVRDAIIRMDIQHPVFHDPENKIWTTLGLYCWPTVLVIGPNQEVLFSLVGESQIQKLSFIVKEALNYISIEGIQINSLALPVVKEAEWPGALFFPGAISTFVNQDIQKGFIPEDDEGTPTDELIIISDSSHHRLVMLNCKGHLIDIIGSGKAGRTSCCYSHSSFNSPRGTANWKNFLFVADTKNHAIRKIDLIERTVSTIIEDVYFCSVTGLEENFKSPWDVCVAPKCGSDMRKLDTLYIAVAGSHQIWTIDLEAMLDTSSPVFPQLFAGCGREECRNNSYPLRSAFAQPSGLSYSPEVPGMLFIADAESSSIRMINLANGSVKKCIGGALDPTNLFEFGDVDGLNVEAKLQHPLSVCVLDQENIFIADTYNNKLKRYNLVTKQVATFVEKIESSNLDTFKEPSSVAYWKTSNALLVADTNQHRIISVDLSSGRPEVLLVELPTATVIDSLNCDRNYFCDFKLAPQGQLQIFLTLTEDFTPTEGEEQVYNASFQCTSKFDLSCPSNTILTTSGPSFIIKSVDDNLSYNNFITIKCEILVCNNVQKTCSVKTCNIPLRINVSQLGPNICECHVTYV